MNATEMREWTVLYYARVFGSYYVTLCVIQQVVVVAAPSVCMFAVGLIGLVLVVVISIRWVSTAPVNSNETKLTQSNPTQLNLTNQHQHTTHTVYTPPTMFYGDVIYL